MSHHVVQATKYLQTLINSFESGKGMAPHEESENGCFQPVFSPSEEDVYFLIEEWPDGYTGHPKSSIWVVNQDGNDQRQLTDLSLFDSPGTWKHQ